MPRRDTDYHGGGSGWRFTWRIDRLQKLHELGRAFEVTEDSAPAEPTQNQDSNDARLTIHDDRTKCDVD